MNLDTLKHKAVDYINHADEEFISIVSILINEYEKQHKQGYVGSKSFSKDNIIKNVLQASDRIKSGKYITQETLEKEVENW